MGLQKFFYWLQLMMNNITVKTVVLTVGTFFNIILS